MIWISKTADRNRSNSCEFRGEIHPFMGTTTTSAKNQLLSQPASQPASQRLQESPKGSVVMEENMVSCSQLEFSKDAGCWQGYVRRRGEVERFQTTTTQVTTPSKRRKRKTKYIREEQANKREKRIIINSAAATATTTTTTVPQSNSH